MTGPSGDYRTAARALDEHLNACPTCRAGIWCGAGDDTAENEFRAWRSWQDHDPTAARDYRRSATP
jgi:hypothetical protein